MLRHYHRLANSLGLSKGFNWRTPDRRGEKGNGRCDSDIGNSWGSSPGFGRRRNNERSLLLVKEPVVVLVQLLEHAGNVLGGELVDVLLLILEFRGGKDDALQLDDLTQANESCHRVRKLEKKTNVRY